MGEMSDYYGVESEGFFDDQDSRPYRKPLVVKLPQPTKTIWVTKSGQRIRVRDMTDSHLIDTIRYLRRTAERGISENLQAAYSMESYLSGEMAQVFIAQDIDTLEEADADEVLSETVPCWETMLAEAEKRKLAV